MKKRHQLRLVGITYNQIQSGVYAVILEEIYGLRRIPIVIGYSEAQAIECKLQDVKTPRPLTHDLIRSIMEKFNLVLRCVDIRRLSTGVFAADLVMEGPDGELHKIDARSSDSIALAIRTGAPIYTTADVLDAVGFYPRESLDNKDTEDLRRIIKEGIPPKREINSFDDFAGFMDSSQNNAEQDDAEMLEFLNNFTDKEIEKEIARFAAQEKYEVAARLKVLLKKRNGGL